MSDGIQAVKKNQDVDESEVLLCHDWLDDGEVDTNDEECWYDYRAVHGCGHCVIIHFLLVKVVIVKGDIHGMVINMYCYAPGHHLTFHSQHKN